MFSQDVIHNKWSFGWISEPSINPEPFFAGPRACRQNSHHIKAIPLSLFSQLTYPDPPGDVASVARLFFGSWFRFFWTKSQLAQTTVWDVFLLKPLVNHGIDFNGRSLNCWVSESWSSNARSCIPSGLSSWPLSHPLKRKSAKWTNFPQERMKIM